MAGSFEAASRGFGTCTPVGYRLYRGDKKCCCRPGSEARSRYGSRREEFTFADRQGEQNEW
jgi:hypothetical protein